MTDDTPTIPAPSCAPTIPPGDYARIGRAGHALTCVLEAIVYGQQTGNELLVDALRQAEMLIRGDIG